MSVDVAIARFRQLQHDIFRGEATVSRPDVNVGGVLAAGNVWVPTAAAAVYSGACVIRAFTWEGTTTESADQLVRLRGVRAKFPVDTDIRKDDVVTVTSSVYDSSLPGTAFRVTDAFRDDYQICRVVIAQEITE